MRFKLKYSTVIVLLWKQEYGQSRKTKESSGGGGENSVVLCTGGKIYRSQDVSPLLTLPSSGFHGDANKASAPPWADNQ